MDVDYELKRKTDLINLTKAIKTNDINQLKYLYENGSDINIIENDGYTALMYAIQYTNIDIITFLFEHCWNIHNINLNGNNALFIALLHAKCSFEDFYDDYIALIEIIKYLLLNGMNIDIVNNEGVHKSAVDFAFNEELKKIIIEYSISNIILK